MRGDQPVVSAASWMVRASVTADQPYHDRVKVWAGCQPAGASAGRLQDRRAVLVAALVEGDDGLRGRVGVAQAGDDRARGLARVAVPRLLDGDRAADVADVGG